jgi:hypothetical protein
MIILLYVMLIADLTAAFFVTPIIVIRTSISTSRTTTTTRRYNWLGDLWDEVIEFSTYGPGERKILKARRQAQQEGETTLESITTEAFNEAKRNVAQQNNVAPNNLKASSSRSQSLLALENTESSGSTDSISLGAFQAAVASSVLLQEGNPPLDMDFDGYALRDLLVEKWGVPLDIDFQRGLSQQAIYCIVLPVAFGSKWCRHESERSYLMHLQGVVEVLQKYNNLELFLDFLKTTNKTPKAGTEFVPFRLEVSESQLKQILYGEL